MNSDSILSLIDELEDNIGDVEANIGPLLNDSLSTTTKKIPLLDKAKLHVLVVYAIESLLFTYLRLHGVAAREHAVFKELTRVKQYYDKIKEAESGPVKPRENLSLNKEAAGRIIKHALSGNNKIDLELREKQAREALLAKRKLRDLEEKTKDDNPIEVPRPLSEPNEPYLSEGEIDDVEQSADVEPSNMSNVVDDQQSSEPEVAETGKSQSRKRRKAGEKQSKQSAKSKKQKRKHDSSSKAESKSSQLPDQG